jgi:hypothetical protein
MGDSESENIIARGNVSVKCQPETIFTGYSGHRTRPELMIPVINVQSGAPETNIFLTAIL